MFVMLLPGVIDPQLRVDRGTVHALSEYRAKPGAAMIVPEEFRVALMLIAANVPTDRVNTDKARIDAIRPDIFFRFN